MSTTYLNSTATPLNPLAFEPVDATPASIADAVGNTLHNCKILLDHLAIAIEQERPAEALILAGVQSALGHACGVVARLNTAEHDDDRVLVEILVTDKDLQQLTAIAEKMGLPIEDAAGRLTMDALRARLLGEPNERSCGNT